jgi:UDP-glucuronate 4-epimerase
MKVLVTGAAGFIGFFVARMLLERGDEVTGLDNLNPYYDVNLKKARLAILQEMPAFEFVKLDLADRPGMESLFKSGGFQRVVHLGAQAGVRYSLENPHAYVDSNLVGTLHVLEGCREHAVEHLVYASTSSVYGANTSMPFSIHQNVDHPLSLYAATKKSNELSIFLLDNRSMFLITAITVVTSPISMTLLRAWFARSTALRRAIRTGTRTTRIPGPAMRLTASTISVTASQWS